MSAKVAYGGRDAIALADAFEPVSAVIDIAMPIVSGIDVARHLRRRYGNDVRIVAYTAWTGADDRRRAAQAGFEQVVAKDADPFDLLAALSDDGHALVMRSLTACRRQVRLQLDLASGLLTQASLAPDPDLAARTRGIVMRTLAAIDAALTRLPLAPAERAALALAVAELRGKLPPQA